MKIIWIEFLKKVQKKKMMFKSNKKDNIDQKVKKRKEEMQFGDL